MSSVTGRRPIDTSTWSTSILSEPFGVSNGTTTPEPVCSSVPTRASPWTVSAAPGQRAGQHVRDVAVRAERQDRRCGSASSSVVVTPRSV